MTTHSRLAFRQLLENLGPLPQSEWDFFSKQFSEMTFAKGEAFVRPDDSGRHLGFVLKGLFRNYYTTEAGDEFIRNFCPEMSLIGPYSTALTGSPSTITIEALEDSTILVFEYEFFQSLLTRHPCWQQIGRKVAENHYISRERREFELLCYDAKKRYACFERDFGNIKHRIAQRDIAAYLGITPVSLSRLLRKNEK